MSEPLFEQHGLLAGSTENGPSAIIDNTRFVVLMGLAVDVMLFGGLIGGYLVLRAGSPTVARGPLGLNPALATMSAFSLGLVSLFLWLSVRAQHHNELQRMRVALACSSVFLFAFLAINASQWGMLLSDPSHIRTIFSAIYLVITGAFHLHVAAGLGYTLVKFRQTLRWRHYTRSNDSITHLSYYFYTMMGVWMVIYFVIYL